MDRSRLQGELPKSDPPRPAGIERNIVITEWDWDTPKSYVHDGISTDKRNPSLNAKGIIYGSPEASSEMIPGWTRREQDRLLQIGISRREDADDEATPRSTRRRRTGARKRSGTRTPTCTIPCSTRKAGCG
jgi:hypothetical protein